MSRVLVTSGPGFFGSRAIFRFLAAGVEARSLEEAAATNTRDLQPSSRPSFIAVDHDQGAERVDAVAGSEFVDDRIRLQE
jgi:hypothetical protein